MASRACAFPAAGSDSAGRPGGAQDNLIAARIHLKLGRAEVGIISCIQWFSFERPAVILLALLCLCPSFPAQPIPATLRQGSLHGFLLLKNQDGKVIAAGDQIDTVRGNTIRSELVFHFGDGSIDDEITVYRQGRTFALLRDHHIQKGPSFPQPLDMTIDVPRGEVTWQAAKNGKSGTQSRHMNLPPDLVNGMLPLAIENFPAGAAEMKVSYLAADPDPRIVQFSIKREGEDRVELGGSGRQAARFNVHIEIGGVAGAVAPLLGKQPSDITIWATEDAVPVVIRTEGVLYFKGPVWDVVLASPVWPQNSTSK
jgi:hypothetical protein